MIKANKIQLATISLLSPEGFTFERFEDDYFVYTSSVIDGYITLYITNNECSGYYKNDITLFYNMSATSILEDEKLKIESIKISI